MKTHKGFCLTAALTAALWLCPQEVRALDGIKAVSAGLGQHVCAVTTLGGVKCWGSNSSQQLGTKSFSTCGPDSPSAKTYDCSLSPLLAANLVRGVKAVAAGADNTCVVTTGGAAKCWGNNTVGQLGDGTTTARTWPTGVYGLGSGVTKISTGVGHVCALTSGGAVKCWGLNIFGQTGAGAPSSFVLKPGIVAGFGGAVTAIAAGDLHTCALTKAGGVKCWGDNENGQLGVDTLEFCRGWSCSSRPVGVSGLGSGIKAIAAGAQFNCALTTAGRVKCWGLNEFGQLGNGTDQPSMQPVDVCYLSNDPSECKPLGGVVAIAAGASHACALLGTGRIRCWGRDVNGALGDCFPVDQWKAVFVSGIYDAAAITAGSEDTCAVTVTAGRLKCWGRSNAGQVGAGYAGPESLALCPENVVSKYYIGGTIKNAAGTPLSGVKVVRVVSGISAWKITNASGFYYFQDILAGNPQNPKYYSLTPSRTGCVFSLPKISGTIVTDVLNANFTGACN